MVRVSRPSLRSKDQGRYKGIFERLHQVADGLPSDDAAHLDWIKNSLTKEALWTEARTRNAELLAEGARIMSVQAAAATNRAQPSSHQSECIAAASAATTAGAAPPPLCPCGRLRKAPLPLQQLHRRENLYK